MVTEPVSNYIVEFFAPDNLFIPFPAVMINHHGKIRIAHGTSILTEDDTALVFAKPKAIRQLKKLFSS